MPKPNSFQKKKKQRVHGAVDMGRSPQCDLGQQSQQNERVWSEQLFFLSSEFEGTIATPVWDVLELKLLEFLASSMVINTRDFALELVEADIVETVEAGAWGDALPVVRYKEVLLPPHEHVLALHKVLDATAPLQILGVGSERRELLPVRHVGALISTPALVLGQEAIARADDLALEVGCYHGILFRESFYMQVPAQETLPQVYVLDFHLHLIHLRLAGLFAVEPASRSEE